VLYDVRFKKLNFLKFLRVWQNYFLFFPSSGPRVSLSDWQRLCPVPVYPFPGPVKLLHRSPSAMQDFCSAEQCTLYSVQNNISLYCTCLTPILLPERIREKYRLCHICTSHLKGTVSRDFLLLVFFLNQFPPSL
jgi:hypothetical protein